MRKEISAVMVALLVGFSSSSACAIDVERMSTMETIATQSVQGDDVISPYHVTGESLVRLMQKMVDFDVPGSKIIFNRRTAQLFVRNTPSKHEQIEKIIDSLRVSQSRQVEIEARIITVSSTDIDDLGLDFMALDVDGSKNYTTDSNGNVLSGRTFGTGSNVMNVDFPSVVDATGNELGGQLGFSILSEHIDLDAYIDALKSRAEVNMVSSPRLIVANNQRANIKIEKAQYYVQSVDTDASGADGSTAQVAVDPEVGIAQSGTVLDVTPTINANGTISLELHPQYVTADLSATYTVDIPNINDSSLHPSVTLPIFTIQNADTTITVQNGGVATIAGLIEEKEDKGQYKVPVLGDIPIIGRMCFQNEQVQEVKTHLLIFIKATVRDSHRSL